MNRTEIVTALKRQCSCYFDAKSGELWKCTPCYTRDYIDALTVRMKEIGCEHCNAQLKEILK